MISCASFDSIYSTALIDRYVFLMKKLFFSFLGQYFAAVLCGVFPTVSVEKRNTPMPKTAPPLGWFVLKFSLLPLFQNHGMV
jgi:hypothetical protein